MRFTIKKILAAAAVPATAVGVLAFGPGVANASTAHSAVNAVSTTHSGDCRNWDNNHRRDCRHHGYGNRHDYGYGNRLC